MDSQSPQDQEIQKEPDPNVYKTEEDDEDEIDRRIRRADERLRRLTIVGAPEFNDDFLCEDTLTVEGGYDTGYAVNYVDCGAAASNQSGGGGGPHTGACCADDGSCSITTEDGCDGTYQGDGTVCDPNPCETPTGACCVDSDCSITTEDDCTGMGGTYQGDDTVCDPNPCMPPCCLGAFAAYDGSGRRFHTKTYTVSYNSNYTVASTGETCSITVNYTRVSSIDPDTCESSVNCSGFYTFDYHPPSGPDVHHEGDPCIIVIGDCGVCPGGCLRYYPSEAEPTCGSTDCSCSATELTCSISHTQDPDCGPDLTGNCSTEVSSVLSDECTPDGFSPPP